MGPLRLSLLILVFFATPAMAGIKLATYNIRNFDYDAREEIRTNKTALRGIINRTRADLIAIQEIVFDDKFKSFVRSNFSQYTLILSKCGGSGRQKLGFLYRTSALEELSVKEDSRVANGGKCNTGLRPAMIVKFRHKQTGLKFAAVAVHLKAGGRQSNADVRYRQYQIVSNIIREIKRSGERDIVVMGDFNTTDYVLRNQNYGRFMDFAEINGLVDFSADLDCTSYWRGEDADDNREEHSLLDHIMMTNSMLEKYDDYSVQVQSHCAKRRCRDVSSRSLGLSYEQVSDHCPVVANMR